MLKIRIEESKKYIKELERKLQITKDEYIRDRIEDMLFEEYQILRVLKEVEGE